MPRLVTEKLVAVHGGHQADSRMLKHPSSECNSAARKLLDPPSTGTVPKRRQTPINTHRLPPHDPQPEYHWSQHSPVGMIPRSHQMVTPHENLSVLHTTRVTREAQENNQAMEHLHLNEIRPPFPAIDSIDHLQLVPHRYRCGFATRNLNLVKDSFQIFASLLTYPTPLPNPITINLLFSLQTVECHVSALGAARKILLTSNIYHATSFVQCRLQGDTSERDIDKVAPHYYPNPYGDSIFIYTWENNCRPKMAQNNHNFLMFPLS